MGCASCANSKDGKPAGCRSNGNCGVSGCNKLDVFDWLTGMELPQGQRPFDMVEVRFKNSRKEFFRNSTKLTLSTGDVVAVESSPGYDVGVVSLTGELVRMQMRKKDGKDNHETKKILRKANEIDISNWQEAGRMEESTMHEARAIASQVGCDMKISDVEYQGDKKKAIFYYTAEGRVDFRELIKKMAESFKCRIEMKQIGARQEAARLGGIGSCGRELCCSTWLTDFRSVSTSAARYQQLALNPSKLAGQCGKLKCCLNFELDQYLEAVKDFPSTNVRLKTQKGNANHFKTDIFQRVMWFFYEGEVGGSPVPVDVDGVIEIIALNKKGEMPESLKEFMTEQPIVGDEIEDYMNVVGQDSLTRFDQKKSRGRGKRKPGGNRNDSRAKQGGGRGKPRRKPNDGGSKPENKEGQKPRAKRPQKPRGPKPEGGNAPKQGSTPKGDGPKSGRSNSGSKPRSNKPRSNKPRTNKKPNNPGASKPE